ncbi:hypothetical protein ACFL3G_02840 [Planctomycetota bacterium]
MNREQKFAWSIVIATSLSFILSCIACVILYIKFGFPKVLLGFTLMGLSGLSVFSLLFIKKDKGDIVFDERDRLIKQRSALAGFCLAFIFVGMACMLPFFILGPQASISVKWLPNIWIGTFICQFFGYSLTLLIQYGRGGGND